MLGVRLKPALEAQLAAVAQASGRTKSDVAREAVRRYVRAHDIAYRAEMQRQLQVVAGLPRTPDDEFWETIGAEDWGDDDDVPESKPKTPEA